MGRKKKKILKKINRKEIIAVIACTLGVGMILVIVLPIWVWIIIVSLALIVYGFNYFS